MSGSVLGAEVAAAKAEPRAGPCACYLPEGTGRQRRINVISDSDCFEEY